MIERYGVKGTELDGVFFTESTIPNAQLLAPIQTEISRQNANLQEVKERMAANAKSLGATVIMNFRYGQKAHRWWELVFTFKWDTESWFGSGDVVRL